MTGFRRAIKESFRYKWSLAASVVNALLIGVLWGFSITTVYPFVEVVLQGQTIETWFDGQIEQSRVSLGKAEREIGELQKQLAGVDGSAAAGLRSQVLMAQSRQAAEEKALAFYQAARPWVCALRPDDRFRHAGHRHGTAALGDPGEGHLPGDRDDARGPRGEPHRPRHAAAILSRGVGNGPEDPRRPRHVVAHVANRSQHRGDRPGAVNPVWHEHSRTVENGGLPRGRGRHLLATPAALPGPGALGGLLVHLLAARTKRVALGECVGMGTILETILETLNGIKTVKIYNRQRAERRRFKRNSWAMYRMGRRITFFDALIKPVTELTGIATIVVAILVGASLVLNQRTHLFGIRFCDRPLSAGALFVFYAMLAGAADPARKMGDIYTVLIRASAACKALYGVFETKPQIVRPANPKPVPLHSRSIRFDNVRFAYVTNRCVLDGVSFEVPFGQTVALVGENGCGKSTVLNLLARFYDPQEGAVLLDGVNLREVSPKKLRRQMAMVAQDPLLFRGTVRENIAYSASRHGGAGPGRREAGPRGRLHLQPGQRL